MTIRSGSLHRAVLRGLPSAVLALACSGGDPGDSKEPTGPMSDPAVVLSLGNLSVVPGGSGSVAITVTRTEYSESLQLALVNPPTGVSGSVEPAVTTGNTATLTVSVNSSVGMGTYPIQVRATGNAIAESIASATLTVIAGPAATLDLSACGSTAGWFAFQDGPGSPWVVVPGLGGRYPIAAVSDRIGLAYSYSIAAHRWTNVVYVAREELATVPSGQFCRIEPPLESKQLAVDVVGIDINSYGTLQLGPPQHFIPLGGGIAAVSAPATGLHDLVAVRVGSVELHTGEQRVVVRRGIDVAALPVGGIIGPSINFDLTGERLAAAPISFSGQVPGDLVGFNNFVGLGPGCVAYALPQNGGAVLPIGALVAHVRPDEHFVWDRLAFPVSVLVGLVTEQVPAWQFGLPATLLQPGEIHGVSFAAFASANGRPVRARVGVETVGGLQPKSYELPSVMPDVTPVNLTSGAYRRLRFQFTLPPDLDDAAVARYSDNQRHFAIRASAAYLGGRNADLSAPDFSQLAGFNSQNAPQGTVFFEVRGEKTTRTGRCTIGRTAASSHYGVF